MKSGWANLSALICQIALILLVCYHKYVMSTPFYIFDGETTGVEIRFQVLVLSLIVLSIALFCAYCIFEKGVRLMAALLIQCVGLLGAFLSYIQYISIMRDMFHPQGLKIYYASLLAAVVYLIVYQIVQKKRTKKKGTQMEQVEK